MPAWHTHSLGIQQILCGLGPLSLIPGVPGLRHSFLTRDSSPRHYLVHASKYFAACTFLARSSVSVCSHSCPFRPEEHGTERPLHNHPSPSAVGFVEAARILGGHLTVRSRTKLRHYLRGAFLVPAAREA
jgi:hypothetical protein